MTWRPLVGLSLKVQVDANFSRYRSALAPLGGPVVMIGTGGAVKLGARATLEIAVVEDDGWNRAAPDVGAHVALRWRM